MNVILIINFCWNETLSECLFRAINPIKKEESRTKDGNKSTYSYAGKKLAENTLAGQQFSSKPFRAENVPLKNIVNEDL